VRDKDRFRGERMSFQTFQCLIERYIADRAKSHDRQQKLSLIFHGGEPTLLDTAELIRFMDYARARIPYISFGMQTNLTNVSAELAIVLRNYGIAPGISIDGWDSRFNRLRLGAKPDPLRKNIRLLRRHGVKCSPLMVLSRDNIQEALPNMLRMLKNFSLPSVKANYVENIYEAGLSYPEITAEELFHQVFMPVIKYFSKKRRIPENNITRVLEHFFADALFGCNNDADKDRVTTNCYVKFCAGGNNVVEVDAEGSILYCGRWDDTHDICCLGSLQDVDPWGLKSYAKVLSVHKNKAADMRAKHCDRCLAAVICDYGCAAFAYAKYRKIRIREDLVCAYYLQVAQYLRENNAKLLEAYARTKKWIVYKDKKVLTLEMPAGYPRLNPNAVRAMPKWSIVETEKQNFLRVSLC
jgi:radical SAM protein with 4Fe4S-binding SPASM domain